MKTRNGFVSNSSSSSFVVAVFAYDDNFVNKRVLSPEKEKILEEHGFKKVKTCNPVDLEMGIQPIQPPETSKNGVEERYNYGYSVIVNQDDVIYFLLKHNISFEGSCHYGHETVVYREGDNYFLRIPNFGLEYGCYHAKYGLDKAMKTYKMMGREPKGYDDIFVKVNVKKYFKNQEKMIDELDMEGNDLNLGSERNINES